MMPLVALNPSESSNRFSINGWTARCKEEASFMVMLPPLCVRRCGRVRFAAGVPCCPGRRRHRLDAAGGLRRRYVKTGLVHLEVLFLSQCEAQELIDDILRLVVRPFGQRLNVIRNGLVDGCLKLRPAYPADPVFDFQLAHAISLQ